MAVKNNLAYDLSLFDVTAAEQPQEVKAKVTKLAQVKSQKHSLRIAASNIIAAVLCTVLAIGLIYSNAQMTEMTYDIQEAQTQLAEKQNEAKRLSVELEKKYDLRTVESVAQQQYGMQKVTNEQKIYVYSSAESHAELLGQTEESLLDRLLTYISAAVNSVQEYFN